MSEKTYKPWPEDGKPDSLDAIVRPLRKAVRAAYKLQRKNPRKDIPWTGHNIGKSALAVSYGPHERLTVPHLQRAAESGRDAMEEILAIAVQLGVEQGQRIMRETMREFQKEVSAEVLKRQEAKEQKP